LEQLHVQLALSGVLVQLAVGLAYYSAMLITNNWLNFKL